MCHVHMCQLVNLTLILGSYLIFYAGDGLAPLPRDSWRGRLPTGTMVNVLLQVRRRRQRSGNVAHVRPLLLHVWARPHPEAHGTLGISSKIGGTKRFQD